MTEEWHDLADPEMIIWCQRLNAIPGVETLQSCSGHKIGDNSKCEGLYRYETDANLWFVCNWLTRETAFRLARVSGMERVRLLFFPDGETVWDLTFAGKNKGCLDASMNEIVSVLQIANSERI